MSNKSQASNVKTANQKKSGILTADEQAAYNDIISKKELQKKEFDMHVNSLTKENKSKIAGTCGRLGFTVDFSTGQLRYASNFEPVDIHYDLCFIRHGKTEGNTEPRVFQGLVDYANNQLNSIGLDQAEKAADLMDQHLVAPEKPWKPDLIVFSPLTRAIKTGEAFSKRHTEIPHMIYDGVVEMAFGNWDNERVIDIPHTSMAHLFYLDQNALVVSSIPHVIKNQDFDQNEEFRYMRKLASPLAGETFIDVLERAASALLKLNDEKLIKSIYPERKAKVLMYSHSMIGAAIYMLLGHGISVDGKTGGALGFDGNYIMPNATPTFLSPQKPAGTVPVTETNRNRKSQGLS